MQHDTIEFGRTVQGMGSEFLSCVRKYLVMKGAGVLLATTELTLGCRCTYP
jgi:hypothetical protein